MDSDIRAERREVENLLDDKVRYWQDNALFDQQTAMSSLLFGLGEAETGSLRSFFHMRAGKVAGNVVSTMYRGMEVLTAKVEDFCTDNAFDSPVRVKVTDLIKKDPCETNWRALPLDQDLIVGFMNQDDRIFDDSKAYLEVRDDVRAH